MALALGARMPRAKQGNGTNYELNRIICTYPTCTCLVSKVARKKGSVSTCAEVQSFPNVIKIDRSDSISLGRKGSSKYLKGDARK